MAFGGRASVAEVYRHSNGSRPPRIPGQTQAEGFNNNWRPQPAGPLFQQKDWRWHLKHKLQSLRWSCLPIQRDKRLPQLAQKRKDKKSLFKEIWKE